MKTKIKETIDATIEMAEKHQMEVREICLNNTGVSIMTSEVFNDLPKGVNVDGITLNEYRGVRVRNTPQEKRALNVKLGTKLMCLLIPLLMAVGAQAQLVARGFIEAAEPYTVYLEEYTSSGELYWMEWQPWAWEHEYTITLKKHKQVQAYFVSKIDGDTLAHVHFVATKRRRKCRKPIRLDGTTQYIGIDEPLARFDTYANTAKR